MGARTKLVSAAVAAAALLTGGILLREPHPRVAPRTQERVSEPLQVQVSGCAAVLRGPVCEVAPGEELRLWLPGVEDASIRVVADGVDLPVRVTPWPDGRTARVIVPEHTTRLDVHVGHGPDDASAKVLLAPEPPVPPGLQKARALRREGRLDEAADVLGSLSEADAGGRSKLLSARARLAYQRGQIDEAIADYREAIGLHETEGRLSEAADDASALAFLFHERDRIADARALVRREAQLSREYPDGQADSVHTEGLIAWDTGDLRTALRCAREAEARFARLGEEGGRRASAVTVGLRLLEVGRYSESIAMFRALLAGQDLGACERADLLNNVGWAVLRAIEASQGADLGIDAREPLAQACDLLRASCPDPNRLGNALLNVAQAEHQHGRRREAREALDEAKRVERDPTVQNLLQWQDLAGRIALTGNAPAQALSSFAREGEIAAAFGSFDEQLSAAEGQSAALVALGREKEAFAVLDEADALVDRLSSSIPFGEGMEGFFAARDRAAVRHVDLLVRLGQPEEAMSAARRWRARALESLRVTAALAQLGPDQLGRWQDAIGRYRALRDAIDTDTAKDWQLPADRLAAARARREENARDARRMLDDALSVLPRARREREQPPSLQPGELELLYVPAPSGWLGFARTVESLTARRIDGIDPRASPEDLARTMLGPFDAAIASATTIRFLPYAGARAVDLQALPWHGRPLLEHAGVEYALGLDAASPSAPDAQRALVVADPSGDLPEARAEADAVTSALTRSDWTVEALRGPAADAESVRRALASAQLLHYAGHASFGGADGVDSALSLARGGRLTPADVLALPRVPEVVVLFGCDTAHESATGTLDALGLTSAFLVAGARVVVATSRVVDDTLARDVAVAFYSRLAATPRIDAGDALREAVLTVRAQFPTSDWASFRVLVP